ncbi:hypothetical protein [Microbulbifer sp. JMSA002]|uniref:hypothetical protein n=1 Tax=Microbulbifer sp. JMSA002 TaxID=3243368 RepID=UPI0040395CD1
MTWIIAKTFVSGYAAMISDVQVTWNKGAHREDCLRKVYAMAPNIACGFSGSVDVGFDLLADMRYFAEQKLLKGEILLPRKFVFEWYRRGRQIFSRLQPSLQKLGCTLIVAGSSLTERAPGNSSLRRSDIIIMRSSNGFTPSIQSTRKVVSVGSGSSKEKYIRFLGSLATPKNSVSIENFDRYLGRGGETLAFLIGEMLKDNPEAGISAHVHCTLIWPNQVRSFPSNFSTFQGEEEVKHEMPSVENTYSGFKRFEKSIHGEASEAIG